MRAEPGYPENFQFNSLDMAPNSYYAGATGDGRWVIRFEQRGESNHDIVQLFMSESMFREFTDYLARIEEWQRIREQEATPTEPDDEA